MTVAAGSFTIKSSSFFKIRYSVPSLSLSPVAQQPLVGQGLLFNGASRAHSDTPHWVGLLWTSDQPVAKTYNTQHSQETGIHATGGFRTRNLSKRAAADPRLKTAWPLGSAEECK